MDEYFIAIVKAYVSYLKEKGLYKTIISQNFASWPVPLLRIIERIDNKDLRDLELEEHVKYCRKLSYRYKGFQYIHSPTAEDEDEHLITIESRLVKKVLGIS